MKLLVTGAAGKVGRNLLKALGDGVRFRDWSLVVLAHSRDPEGPGAGGRARVAGRPGGRAPAMAGVTHVVHLAAVKESPELAMDVAVKGMFLLLEEFRQSPDAARFVLMSGDCVVGHIFQPYDAPITEADPPRLSRVLRADQGHRGGDARAVPGQYDLDGCILRAPWIMEKDDFRFALSFGPDQFGGPPWRDLLPEAELEAARRPPCRPGADRTGPAPRSSATSCMSTTWCPRSSPRSTAPAARQQAFNIAMDRPVDYAMAAATCRGRAATSRSRSTGRSTATGSTIPRPAMCSAGPPKTILRL
jgi:UDP-glucose 4-epimerase